MSDREEETKRKREKGDRNRKKGGKWKEMWIEGGLGKRRKKRRKKKKKGQRDKPETEVLTAGERPAGRSHRK